MLEITAWAESREDAIAFLQAVNIATVDENGVFIPIAEVQITPSGANDQWQVKVKTGQMVEDPFGNMVEERVPLQGFSWNMRFFGTSEATLRKPEPKGGWQPEDDIFARTYILELVEGRTKLIPEWVASAEDVVPPGYVAGKCRAFDPALIASRSNVWA
jgi:hypothetical protein